MMSRYSLSVRDRKRQVLSLNSKGARQQLSVAIALVAIIPMLALGFIIIASMWAPRIYTVWTQVAIAVLALGIGGTGYWMLRKYPRHIENLREYLHSIAEGRLPSEIRLGGDMEEVSAIAHSLNTIIQNMRGRMDELESQLQIARELQATIESQGRELLEAERHRVMVESLGAACHHLGQPATVLRLYLESIPESGVSAANREKLKECRDAIECVADILNRLRNVSQYRTVPYQTFSTTGHTALDSRILDID